jgi:phosphinothricin acetyltransferase
VVDAATDRVRPATEDDLGAVNDIYNHYVHTSHVTFDVDPTGIEWRRQWFEEHADSRCRIFVATVDGRVIGYASSGRYRAKAAYETAVQTSVYVAPDFVGRGVGASLYAVLLDALEREDVHRALAGIAQPNEASVALHRVSASSSSPTSASRDASLAGTGTSTGTSARSDEVFEDESTVLESRQGRDSARQLSRWALQVASPRPPRGRLRTGEHRSTKGTGFSCHRSAQG